MSKVTFSQEQLCHKFTHSDRLHIALATLDRPEAQMPRLLFQSDNIVVVIFLLHLCYRYRRVQVLLYYSRPYVYTNMYPYIKTGLFVLFTNGRKILK